MKKPLSKALRTFYGIGDFGFSLMTSVEMYCFSFFLTNVAKFSLGLAAVIMTITSAVDAVLAPIYGGIISGSKPMKWGRYRSWLITMPPIVMILYMFQFTKIGNDITAAIIICAGFILSHIAWNLCWVSNVSLVSVLASNPDERALLASRRATWTGCTKLVVSYTGMPLALWLGSVLKSEVIGFTVVAGLMAFCMMLGYFAHFAMTKGYEDTKEEAAAQAQKAPKEKTSLGDMLKNLFQNVPLMILMLADFSRYLANFIMTGVLAYIFTYIFQNMALMPVYVMIGAVTTIVGSYLSAYLCKKFSTRTISISGMIGFGAFLLSGKFASSNVYVFIVLMALSQFFVGALASSMVALYGDAAVYGHWKTGKDATAFVMGLMNFPLKISIVVRGLILTAALAAANFSADIDPAMASDALKGGLLNIFTMIPGVLLLISALLLIVGFKLTRSRLTQYQQEIETRRVQA